MCPQLAERATGGKLADFLLRQAKPLKKTPRRLLLELANPYFEADHAVVIAQRKNRKIARYVVFHLNNLLRGLRNVGRVGHGEVVLNLLFDRDRRRGGGGRGLRVQALGINPDMANAEQTPRAVA